MKSHNKYCQLFLQKHLNQVLIYMHSNDYESMRILGNNYDGFEFQIAMRFQLNQTLQFI